MMLDRDFGTEYEWHELAVEAGDVGRFIWNLDTGECQIDDTLREITGLMDKPVHFPAAEFISHVHKDDQKLIADAAAQAQATGVPYVAEFRFLCPDGELIWISGRGAASKSRQGDNMIIGVNYDVTDLRIEQHRADLIAGEMGHRVKNILTMVSSIFTSTARTSEDIKSLSEAFMSRLHALSAFNDILLQNGSTKVDLRALVEAILRPVTGMNIKRDIADLRVNSATAQALALSINELLTNAVKYGGLAVDQGGVSFSIKRAGDDLVLDWEEKMHRTVKAPTKPDGFGMRVLNNITAATYRGRPQFTWRPEGMKFQCEWLAEDVIAE